ncbi:hypothetical protein M8C21_027383, partial [Ambrosia artemisiifolia]
VESSSSTRLPTWLESLFSEKFFNPCMNHEYAKKNEQNIFCLDCCEAICHHCLHLHKSHRLLQIRRYLYHDVIRVGDAEKLMDCSYVQAYTTNRAKVVFLNPRPQTTACRNLTNNCISCERGLQHPYLFCSISCKVHHIMTKEGMMSEYLHECEILTLPEPGSDDWLMTPDSVIAPFISLTTSSHSTPNCTKVEIPAAAAARESITSPETVNRRKGMPRRSPFN